MESSKDRFSQFVMAASQDHGFLFEAFVSKEVDRRLGSAGAPPPGMPSDHTARFDLPAWRDPTCLGLPTSIKMTKNQSKLRVDMADAKRVVGLANVPMWRLVVGIYDQVGDKKVTSEIRVYTIPDEIWSEITGDIPPILVSRFHDSLKEGTIEEARAAAKKRKAKLTLEYPGILRWGAKIDRTNRRLQCVLPLELLEALMLERGMGEIHVYGVPRGTNRPDHLKPLSPRLWGGLGPSLPVSFYSPPRPRKKKVKAEPA